MKTFAVLVALLMDLHVAHANPPLNWYDARRSTCSSLQKALVREGKFLIVTGEDVYDLVVYDQSGCLSGETTKASWVKTRDVERCPLGSKCRTP